MRHPLSKKQGREDMKRLWIFLITMMLAVCLCLPALASVGVKKDGSMQGAAIDIDIKGGGSSDNFDGSTYTVNVDKPASVTTGAVSASSVASSGAVSGTTGTFTGIISGKVFTGTQVALSPSTLVTIDCSLGELFTLMPGQAESVTFSNLASGQKPTLIISASGGASYNLTFSPTTTLIRTPTAALATGTANGKKFVIDYVSDGTYIYEKYRTSAE